MSVNIGFALIPDQATIEKIVDVEAKISEVYGFTSKLRIGHNLPHITIFQNTFDDKIPYVTLLNKTAVEFTRLNEGRVHFTDVIYEYGGWYFYLLQKTDRLQELHEYILYHSKDYIVDKPKTIDEALPYWQKKGLLDFGYRYSGEAYMPHITLAKTAESERNDAVIQGFSTELKDAVKEAEIQKITAYRIDENGSYVETLSEIVLLPCKQSRFVTY